jgi:hypothetical protein
MRNNKRYTWDIYKVIQENNEWLSRHFDKTYDEMMLILTEDEPRENFEVQIYQYFHQCFMISNEKTEEVYLLQIFQ